MSGWVVVSGILGVYFGYLFFFSLRVFEVWPRRRKAKSAVPREAGPWLRPERPRLQANDR